MDYVSLGSSGLEVSRVCLGCMGLGAPDRGSHPWTLPESDAYEVIRAALELGVNFFDTANTYSDGSSEEILGRALARYARRDEVVIASKVGLPTAAGPNRRGLSRKAIIAELDASLSRLGTDYIDVYQIHRWDPRTPLTETLGALENAVQSGKVRYLGASSMPAWQFSKLIHVGRQSGFTPFVSMQSHYNALYREEEREMIPLCIDENVAVLPWSPLARGLLATPWGTQDIRSSRDTFRSQLYGVPDRDVVDLIQRHAAAGGISMAQLALAWLASQPAVAAPLVGAASPGHVAEAVAAVSLVIPPETMRALDACYQPHPVAGVDVLPQHEIRQLSVPGDH